MYKIAAYITVYNDINAVEYCLKSLIKQSYCIQGILIVDNSQKFLDSHLFLLPNITFNRFPENIGVAGGLKIALEWATKNNYDFLWTFDQDSEPLPDTLEKLLSSFNQLNAYNLPIGIIAPKAIDVQSNISLDLGFFNRYKFINKSFEELPKKIIGSTQFYECDFVITSGSLINLKLAKILPFPDPDLFIDGVDMDYCMNFRKRGYKVIVVDNAILKHNFGTYKKYLAWGFINLPIYTYSDLRYYYTCRNHTFLETQLAQRYYYFIAILNRLCVLGKKLVKIILFESDNKIIKIWACLKGTCDGFAERLGKTW